MNAAFMRGLLYECGLYEGLLYECDLYEGTSI